MDPIINSVAAKQIEDIQSRCRLIKPRVAIHSLAYNHGPYIRDALEGFVCQKTDFSFVAIVHDDASTDNTSQIIQEYAEKYPEIILPIYEKENQYSIPNGALGEIMRTAIEATGAEYVAMCEGDDYWTDPNKLQTQINYLNDNPDIVYSCHCYSIIDNKNELTEQPIPRILKGKKFVRFNSKQAFWNEWFTKTLTSVIRSNAFNTNLWKKYDSPRDIHLIYEVLKMGDGCIMDYNGGVYRKHAGGVCSPLSNIEKNKQYYQFWEQIFLKENTKLTKKILTHEYLRVVFADLKYNFKLRLFKSPVRLRALILSPYFIFRYILNKLGMV